MCERRARRSEGRGAQDETYEFVLLILEEDNKEESERWGALRGGVVVGKRKEKKKPKKLWANSYILEGSRTGYARTQGKRSGREG